MALKQISFLVIIYIFQLSNVFCQKHSTVNGSIKDEQGKFISGINITIGSDFKTTTNNSGFFSFTQIPVGSYQITFQGIGFDTRKDSIQITGGQHFSLDIILTKKTHEVSEVTVFGKSETQQAGEQAVRAVIVDTKSASLQAVTLTELMNQSPGIRIRQSGGLGSRPDISMNGFQGRAIRYFKDGVPLNFLGGGYGIHNIPVNSLERVEVYKGVLPIALGADALGGAVNLVTRKSTGNQLDASYEIASFNTHRLTFNGNFNFKNNLYAGLEAFYNYSKNNYDAFVMVPDPETRNPSEQKVELFHNAYKGGYTEGYIGLQNKSWAENLRLSLIYFDTQREQQHPALMTSPYGAAHATQNSLVPTLRYQGRFFEDKFSIDQFLVYNTLKFNTTDTIRGFYDWYGNFTSVPGRRGESARPSLSDVDVSQFTSRTLLGWQWNEKNRLTANFVHTESKRIGEDPLGPKYSGTDIDVLSLPAYYTKQVAGVDWNSRIHEKWEASIMAKWYRYQSKGTESWGNRPISIDEKTRISKHYGGLGTAVKYQLSQATFYRFSTEYAYRLPEVDELFGDAVWVVPNFALTPERSLNFNLGISSQKKGFGYEINTFYRETKDLILLVPTVSPYAQHQNMENVRGFGLEADGNARLNSWLKANANFTWQSLRMFGYESPQDQWKNGTRLQNTPFFFANIGLIGNFKSSKGDGKWSTYLNYNFVREFYLLPLSKEAEPNGFLGLWGKAQVESEVIIPNQHLLSGGVNYRFSSDKYAIGVEVKNITDSRLYDYFRVQRAGRSFHLKLTYQLTNNKI